MNTFRIQQLKTMPYEKYLQTPEWEAKREQILRRDHYRCTVCDSHDNLHVHHYTYARRGHEHSSDLTTLCMTCHERTHRMPKQEDCTTEKRAVISKEDFTIKSERYLLGLLVTHPYCRPYVVGIVSEDDFFDAGTRDLYPRVVSAVSIENKPIIEELVPSDLDETVFRCVKAFISGDEPANGVALVKDAVVLASKIKYLNLKRISEGLATSVSEAAKAKDNDKLKQLTQRLLTTNRQLRTIETVKQLA